MHLCNDIMSIVYRYLFDYDYKMVREQYREKWIGEGTVRWNDTIGCFVHMGGNDFISRLVANWRLLGGEQYTEIRSLNVLWKRIVTGTTSKNY